MSNVANQLTSPLGVKLFKGGPYADRGLGDQAMAASAPLQAEGQTLIQEGQQYLPFLMSMLTGSGSLQGAGGGTAKTDSFGQPIGGTTGAYGLSPVFQSQLNALTAPINMARKQALQAAKASMSARGLAGAPGAERALEQTINAAAESDLTTAHNQVMQAQQASFQQSLQNALNMIATGGGLVQQNVGTLQQQAGAAQQRTQQASSDLFSAIGAGIAGAQAFGGKKGPGGVQGGTPPFAAPMGTSPAAGVDTTGAGIPPGFNPFAGMVNPTQNWGGNSYGWGVTLPNPQTGKNLPGG